MSKNPITDAIMSIAGEYRSLIEKAPKEKVPSIMQEARAKKSSSVSKWLEDNLIKEKDFEGVF